MFASSVNQRLKYDFILSEKDSSFSVSFEVVDPKVTAVLMKSSTLMDHWGLIRGKEIFEQNISSFLALEPPADGERWQFCVWFKPWLATDTLHPEAPHCSLEFGDPDPDNPGQVGPP